MAHDVNFVFFGTPDVAEETLEILKANGYMPALIITSPDARQGRKMVLTPPPVKVWAEKNSVPFLQPEKLNEEFIDKLKAGSYELFIVVAYGKMIPEKILNLPKLGSLNVHYSLLPKYRGASPVESAIRNGDAETGVSIQKMVYEMDAGPIIAQEKVKIAPDETAPELRKRLIQLGGDLLIKVLPDFIAGKIEPMPQDDAKATIAKKIKKEDGEIDLTADPVRNYNTFRAYIRWPRTFFFKNGKRIIITDVALENGEFKIKKVLPEGKKETTWENFQSTL